MAHHQNHHRQRVPALHNFLKMLLSSEQTTEPTGQETEVVDDADEPPDHHLLSSQTLSFPPHLVDGQIYVKSPPIMPERKESLLTQALLNSPDLIPVDRDRSTSSRASPPYPLSHASGHSTASDGDLTSPTFTNTPSPPHVALHLPPVPEQKPLAPPTDPSESKVEADLGRKRCISFACGRRMESKKPQDGAEKVTKKTVVMEKRQPTLKFFCPTRQSELKTPSGSSSRRTSSRGQPCGSPAPLARKSPAAPDVASRIRSANETRPSGSSKKPGSIHMSGLGGFEPSEETRFHEFASSADEVDEWVADAPEYKEKITLNDCMKKENAIRQLGEEAEAEAIAEEEAENSVEVDDDDEQGDESTIHDFSSDDGNETDNEAGFAESDDESDDGSDYGFWAPSTTTAATSADNLDLVRLSMGRRDSNTSIDSLKHEESTPARRDPKRRGIKIPRPDTIDLPDSTDFVCGTLDEDRPLEAAYLSHLEELRRKKHVPIPQDIDPSFPTTDPEDNDDLEEEEDDDDDLEEVSRIEEELLRGRAKGNGSSRTSPRATSPKRHHSPPPRHHGPSSPKRMKSPAPKSRNGSNAGFPALTIPVRPTRVNITGPVQRPHYTRTKSLPRTPNPFFVRLERARQSPQSRSRPGSPERALSRTREPHTRGPVDIIQGLERKRQKRKEKFWRQHCRKVAKEQTERRPLPGKGAERMKELGLEVAERFKAYGVGQDAQLVLSV
jgi:hypothetical protein